MNFVLLRPWALAGLALAALLVWAYWRPMRPGRHLIATARFWAAALAGGPSPWRRRRRWLSLALQLGILTLLVLALAEPAAHRPRSLAMVIDNGASAAAIERSKELVAATIDSLGEHDRAAIVTTAGPLRVRSGPTGSKQRLHEALEAVDNEEPGSWDAALDLAQGNGDILLFGEQRPLPDTETAWVNEVEQRWAGRPPAWSWFVAAGLLLIAVEWVLYHRRWTE